VLTRLRGEHIRVACLPSLTLVSLRPSSGVIDNKSITALAGFALDDLWSKASTP